MPGPRSKILFLTNSDYGLANVVLAAAHSLLHQAPEVEVHIASFQPLEQAVDTTSKLALETAPEGSAAQAIIFHRIDGDSWGPAAFRPEAGLMEAYDLTPGLVNTAKATLVMPSIFLPWQPHEFVAIYKQIGQIFSQVIPDVTVVEPLFSPGLTLCHDLQARWIVLAPNTIKDFALPAQPGLAMLWKYPFVGSGIPFPVPWVSIVQNVLLGFVAAYAVLTSNRVKEVTALLHKQVREGVMVMTASELGVLSSPPPGLRLLVSSSPDIDLPMVNIPAHIVPCGPIIRAAPRIESVDPDLASWLEQGPTVFVNLGTQLRLTPSEALEMALALRDMLDRSEAVGYGKGRKLQVLWKLARKAEPGVEVVTGDYSGPWKEVCDVLSPELETARVRITDWVVPEPRAVLETGRVVCSLHHGGASSFNEALCIGVPQVILPPWADCYDFGNRAEILKVGRWANQGAKPRWKRDELASCLDDVLFGPRSEEILARAKDLAARHGESAGRQNAAREILSLLS
ncbi:UDP-Glycosyltransferase/glycogen phosphorylase [Thozetella sp. PMI_491]|nr:UDP-Glycosyltransferase/glycogen phosphorylase [Thozetella sp. PMI_491]